MTDFKKTFTPTTRMWAKIATTAIASIKKRTQRGRDRNGRVMPPYSKKYAENKAKGFTTKVGRKVKSLRGISTNRQVSPPNFRLRGFTIRDLSLLAKSALSAVIGWRGEFATIVAAHEERGKYKVGGITPKEHEELVKIADKHFQDQWNRTVKVETFNVKL